jgi:molecular chaperone GrpE
MTEPQTDTGQTQATPNPNGDFPAQPNQQTQNRQDVDLLQQELAEARNQVLRAQAELENVRRRMRREMEDERRFAAGELLRDLFPALDNLQRAVDAASKTEGGAGLAEGVTMVLQQITQALEHHGCRRIPTVGEAFDPHVHQAITQQPSDTQPAGTILLEAQSGYQLHDRVLRPAQVIVSSGPTHSQS